MRGVAKDRHLKIRLGRAAPAMVLGTTLLASTAAFATDASQQTATGAREKALAGAGVAYSTDATAASLNPAGLVNVGNQVTVSTSLLKLRGGYSTTGAGGFVADGSHSSERDPLVIPNLAANWRVNWGFADAVAVTAYVNAGVATRYGNMASPTCAGVFLGSGVYCGGVLGVNMQQMFVSVAFAKQLAPGLSIGVAPILSRTTLEVKGANLFSQFSWDGNSFSDQGTDEAWGGGLRAGLEYKVAPGVRFGIAGNTRISQGNFNRYRGMLAEQGSMDGAPTLQTGLAFDLRNNVTMMLDYKRIWFSSIRSLSNPSDNWPANQFGVAAGPGFGLQDLNIFKIAFEWQAMPAVTLRAGYSYNTAPFTSRDADLSTMTLGQVQHHIATGAKIALTSNFDLELAAMYAPRASVSGTELGNPFRNVTVEMSEFEFTIGGVYRFDQPSRRIEPLK